MKRQPKPPQEWLDEIKNENEKENVFNFDDDIFEKENNSVKKYKIINTYNFENKKFNS